MCWRTLVMPTRLVGDPIRRSGRSVVSDESGASSLEVVAGWGVPSLYALGRVAECPFFQVDHAAGQSLGDHFEGHFEGQNGVSECQPESGSVRAS
jgi:hypothetical protein